MGWEGGAWWADSAALCVLYTAELAAALQFGSLRRRVDRAVCRRLVNEWERGWVLLHLLLLWFAQLASLTTHVTDVMGLYEGHEGGHVREAIATTWQVALLGGVFLAGVGLLAPSPMTNRRFLRYAVSFVGTAAMLGWVALAAAHWFHFTLWPLGALGFFTLLGLWVHEPASDAYLGAVAAETMAD